MLSLVLILFTSLALGAPLVKRQRAPLSSSDVAVLQLALFLEHLETSLYSGGYNNFTEAQFEAAGFPAPFRQNVGVIAQQEAIHASTIANVLSANGIQPISPCVYKFPYTDPRTFVGLSDLITTTGIGAYLGGALGLKDNPALLTTASSILTAEARHDAYLRAGNHQSPFPNAFDTPLTAVYANQLAMPFLANCPQLLPISQLPELSIAPSQFPASTADSLRKPGSVDVTWTGTSVPVASGTPLYLAFIQGTGLPLYVSLTQTGPNSGSASIPAAINGTAFAVLTTFAGGLNLTQLTTTGTLAGPVVYAVQTP